MREFLSSSYVLLLCSSRKNPYPHHGRSLGIPRGSGVLKSKILEAKYEAKLESWGEGVQYKKTFRGWSMDIFWNCTFRNRGNRTFSTLYTVNICIYIFYIFFFLNVSCHSITASAATQINIRNARKHFERLEKVSSNGQHSLKGR